MLLGRVKLAEAIFTDDNEVNGHAAERYALEGVPIALSIVVDDPPRPRIISSCLLLTILKVGGYPMTQRPLGRITKGARKTSGLDNCGRLHLLQTAEFR
jgi:hypothetical protein